MTAKQAITDLRKPGKAYIYVDVADGYPLWVEAVKSDLLDKLKALPSDTIVKLYLEVNEPGS